MTDSEKQPDKRKITYYTRSILKLTGSTTNTDSDVDSTPAGASANQLAVCASPSETMGEPTLSTILAAIKSLEGDMNARFNALDSKLNHVESSLANHATRISDLEQSGNDYETRMAKLEKSYNELMESNKAIQRKLIDISGRSRRSNIIISGLREKLEQGNPTQFITDLLPKLLGPENFPKGIKVDRSHRLGYHTSPSRPRLMIARIHHPPVQEKIVKLARQSQLSFNGHKIGIFPDVPPEVLEQRRKFDDVKKKLKAAGLRNGFIFPARLIFTHGDDRKIFNEPKEAEDYVDRFITPTPATAATPTDAGTSPVGDTASTSSQAGSG